MQMGMFMKGNGKTMSSKEMELLDSQMDPYIKANFLKASPMVKAFINISQSNMTI